jgi:poly-gamma-glutamate synthesis protein (capsule biosynthesis protein)
MQWILLTGDAMLGRGIDLIQAASCDPMPPDFYGRSATDLIRLAEARNGPIPRGVDPAYVWGEALDALAPFDTALRIVNLETPITTASDFADKRVTYRIHPANVALLRAFGADCCVLANNHMLDCGEDGLRETLGTLDDAEIAHAGAGLDAKDAWRPAVLPLRDGTRAIVLSMGGRSAGVPAEWAAGQDRPGVAVLSSELELNLSAATELVRRVKRPGDIAIASIHWGENWGFEITERQSALAKGLIDRAGIDIVHGHSSHHPKQIAHYRGKLILFGCGGLIDDYEGLDQYRQWRPDLVALHLVGIEAGAVRDLRMLPMRIRRMRLERASAEDARWLCRRVTRHSGPMGTAWALAADGTIHLRRKRGSAAS